MAEVKQERDRPEFLLPQQHGQKTLKARMKVHHLASTLICNCALEQVIHIFEAEEAADVRHLEDNLVEGVVSNNLDGVGCTDKVFHGMGLLVKENFGCNFFLQNLE